MSLDGWMGEWKNLLNSKLGKQDKRNICKNADNPASSSILKEERKRKPPPDVVKHDGDTIEHACCCAYCPPSPPPPPFPLLRHCFRIIQTQSLLLLLVLRSFCSIALSKHSGCCCCCGGGGYPLIKVMHRSRFSTISRT